MKVSELMRAMSEAGAPMEAILIAVQAIEGERDAIEQRRSADRERKRRQRANKGEDGGTVTGRSRDMSGTVTDEPSLSRPPNEIISNPPTHTHPDNKHPRVKGPAKPTGVADQTWADFLDLRKRKRAALTETALAGIVREAAKAGWSLEEALAETVTRGWQSFKAEFVEVKKPPGEPASFLEHYRAKQSSA